MYNMFKFVILKVPLLKIQMFRTFREIMIRRYYMYMHVLYTNYTYKLYQLFVEMQDNIRFYSPL